VDAQGGAAREVGVGLEGVITLEVEGPAGKRTPFSMEVTHWYAEHVGSVKSSYRSQASTLGDAGTGQVVARGASELQSFTTPPALARPR
jgi:hypothetical protein